MPGFYHRSLGLWFGALIAGLNLFACGATDETEDDVGVRGSANVLYGELGESDAELFPSNRYTVVDNTTRTGLRVDLSERTLAPESQLFNYPTSLRQLNELDGFSAVGGVIVKFDAPIDFTGYRAETEDGKFKDALLDASHFTREGSPFYLMDVDPNSEEYGELVGLVPAYYGQGADRFWLFDDYTLVLHPAVPLKPLGKYLFLMTEAQKAADGTPVARSAFMHRTLTGQLKDDYSSQLLASLEEQLPKLALSLKEVVAASLFTVADIQTGVIEMAKARRAAPLPSLESSWEVRDENERIVGFKSHFSAPEYRKENPDGKWELNELGGPVIQKEESLEVFLTFSNKDESGPRPIVIYGHGLGGDKGGVGGTAGRLAELSERGVAVFGIDSPEHGSRTEGETSLISSVYGFFGIEQGTQEFDIGRARDNFRQMASDQLELVRLIKSLEGLDLLPLGAPDGVPDLDTSQILYIGHSFGSVQGATIGALAPEIRAANWNVGGAGLMMLLRDSNMFRIVVENMAPTGNPFGSIASFMAITQGIVDPGDPLNYARHMSLSPLSGVADWRPRHVLIQEVVDDAIVPNSTTEALARAAGASLLNQVVPISGIVELPGPVSGNLKTGSTSVISQFDRVEEGTKKAEHGGLIFTPEAREQYVRFFQSVLSGEPQVDSPYE